MSDSEKQQLSDGIIYVYNAFTVDSISIEYKDSPPPVYTVQPHEYKPVAVSFDMLSVVLYVFCTVYSVSTSTKRLLHTVTVQYLMLLLANWYHCTYKIY